MLFIIAQYIKDGGLGAKLALVLGPYFGLAVFLIPFAVGLATGVEFTFAGLAFPPILLSTDLPWPWLSRGVFSA